MIFINLVLLFVLFWEQEANDIELQPTQQHTDIRMSPILGLRQRTANYATDYDDTNLHMRNINNSSCMAQPPPRVSYATSTFRGGHTQIQPRRRYNTSAASSQFQRRRRVISSIKRKAKEFREKIPSVKDVNKIDKYSRLVFPSLFIVFNLSYWFFYMTQ